MEREELVALLVDRKILESQYLNRKVTVDVYYPKAFLQPGKQQLLFINDGQDLPKMPFAPLLDNLLTANLIQPLLCIGIHAGEDRRMEYGTAKILDFMQ
ncbi:MAG TPA: hypothetical protein VD794_15975, partial [Flavisolibacter sp.]|nr:hypothetical protein [Flavisolibacter sp.]